ASEHSGRAVTWSGSPPAVGISSEALADPRGSVEIDVAAPSGTLVGIRDSASVVDAVRVSQLGATIVTPLAVGTVVGNAGGERFWARSTASLRCGSIVVVAKT